MIQFFNPYFSDGLSLVTVSPTPILRSSGLNHCQTKIAVPPFRPDISLLHQPQTTNKMKVTTIIIAAALTLSVNVLFASNDNTSVLMASANNTLTLTSLAQAVPAEADFEDAVVMVDFSVLAPVIPFEAQFEDMTYEMVSALNLAPVTPATADVDESEDFSFLAPITPATADVDESEDLGSLAPVVPAEADFE